jgi:hypothetical protein
MLWAAGVALSSLAGVNGYAAEGLREMTTDRPDATESPFTVNPGHVQLEMDLANFGRDREGGDEVEEWEAAPFNVRFGVTENFELGVFVTPYRRVTETPAGGPRVRSEGVGDPVLRAKWNFFGNDEGDVALGVIADVKVPIGERAVSNREWEGAVMLPVAFEIGGGWEGAAMTGVDIVYSDAGEHRAVWSNTLTAGRAITERVGMFLEVTSAAGDGAHVATGNVGFTLRWHENLQYDAGVNLGLTEAATDVVVFVGMTRRW